MGVSIYFDQCFHCGFQSRRALPSYILKGFVVVLEKLLWTVHKRVHLQLVGFARKATAAGSIAASKPHGKSVKRNDKRKLRSNVNCMWFTKTIFQRAGEMEKLRNNVHVAAVRVPRSDFASFLGLSSQISPVIGSRSVPIIGEFSSRSLFLGAALDLLEA